MGDLPLQEVYTMALSYQQDWIRIQDILKGKLVVKDDFTWTVPITEERVKAQSLRYIGGVDVSFLKGNASLACGALVILDAYTLEVVYEDYNVVQLDIPYVPGFLAFREAPILLGLLDKMKRDAHPYYPQLLMVDGNGFLHPRGFGLACHLGVLADLPTIGIGKNLFHVDGLTPCGVRQHLEAKDNCAKDLIPLLGKSGQVWGMALRSTTSSSKPIYISVGHRISLDSSVRLVRWCCKFRLPEPIRLADIRSRLFLQRLQEGRPS